MHVAGQTAFKSTKLAIVEEIQVDGVNETVACSGPWLGEGRGEGGREQVDTQEGATFPFSATSSTHRESSQLNHLTIG